MNPDKVSQSTRNRVEQPAPEALLPQSLGRNMKRNESRTILVIVPDICDPREIIRVLKSPRREQEYLVLIGDCAHQNRQEKDLYRPDHYRSTVCCCCLAPVCPLMRACERAAQSVADGRGHERPELELPTVVDNPHRRLQRR